MNQNLKHDALNTLLSVALIIFGIYVLATGEIKNMQLGNERIIPASAVIIFGIWLLIRSGIKIMKR